LLPYVDPKNAPATEPSIAGNAILQSIQPPNQKRSADSEHHTNATEYECARACLKSNPRVRENISELKRVFPPPKNAWYAPRGKPNIIATIRDLAEGVGAFRSVAGRNHTTLTTNKMSAPIRGFIRSTGIRIAIEYP
jgi:hypothetical protein